MNSEMTNGLLCFMTDLAGQRPNRMSGLTNPRVHRGLNGGAGGIRTALALTTQPVRQPCFYVVTSELEQEIICNESQRIQTRNRPLSQSWPNILAEIASASIGRSLQ